MVQEAFLRILDAAYRYRSRASFRTYLYRVLMRLCIDHKRKFRPIPTDKLPYTPPLGPKQVQRIECAETQSAVRKALDALPSKYRLVIILRHFEGLSGAEIAVAMNTTPKAVERLLARARRNLEPLLRPFYAALARADWLAATLVKTDAPPVPAGLHERVMEAARAR